MKWQHEYRDIGLDDHFNTLEYHITTGHERVTTDVRGPHQNREMGLMLAGRKPCALIDPGAWPLWSKFVREHGWPFVRLTHTRGASYVIALPGMGWRVQRMKSIFDHAFKVRGCMTTMDHARIGFLLGYRKEDIRHFIDVPVRIAA